MSGFPVSLWGLLGETFRRSAKSLAQADLAFREGKALDQLRERVVGLCGITNMRVEDRREEDASGMVNICLLAGRSLTAEEESMVRLVFAEVNRRYATSFRLCRVVEDKEGIKQGSKDVKKS